MRVVRRGARADHGQRQISFSEFSLDWDVGTRTFDLTPSTAVRDFSTDARHNYTFEFSPNDIVKILKGIDENMVSIDQSSFIESFEAAVPALMRIINGACGVWYPVGQPADEQV